MKKIPTLFKRVFNENSKTVVNEVTEGLEYILTDENVIPTIKWDGSCCAIIDNELYKRYTVRKGRLIPDGVIKCQDEPDTVTGHLPCWVKCDENNLEDRWFIEAYNNWKSVNLNYDIEYQTFEAIGPHFRSNFYDLASDTLVPHGKNVIKLDKPLTFESIKEYLSEHNIEGIVFWKDNEPICKIKRSDFGFDWTSYGINGKYYYQVEIQYGDNSAILGSKYSRIQDAIKELNRYINSYVHNNSVIFVGIKKRLTATDEEFVCPQKTDK